MTHGSDWSSEQRRQQQIEAEFESLCSRIKKLRAAVTSADADLHFEPLTHCDEALWATVLGLAQDGLAKVREHRAYFATHALYDDGMFWYDLFLLISAAASGTRDTRRKPIPYATVKALTTVLVEISEFTTPSGLTGDITIRNFEALGNVLLAWRNQRLLAAARRTAERVGKPEVQDFVGRTIARVEQVRRS